MGDKNIKQFTYYTKGDYPLPKFGFKIHISTRIEDYENVYPVVQKYLWQKSIYYKVFRSKSEYIQNISKYASPSESGKLFTIYPRDVEMARGLLEDLYDLLSDYQGIYILSDRSYKNSNTIYYRFGFFQNTDNFTLHHGNLEWKDGQKNYFDLPDWIEDPFLSSEDEEILSERNPLSDYTLTGIIQSSNGGNIYQGDLVVQEDSEIIVKESRPHILVNENLKVRELREKEYEICQKLNSFGFPKAIERFDMWINRYFVYQKIKGEKLNGFPQKLELHKELNDKKLAALNKSINNLIQLVDIAHEKNIILDDIHPSNFLFDDNFNVYFIDLELAHFNEEQIKITSKNKGYYLEEWNDLDEYSKDLRKVGQVILDMIGKFNVFENQDRTIQESILFIGEFFVNQGYQTNINQLLTYLFSGNSAKEAVNRASQINFQKIGSFTIKDELMKSLKKFESPESLCQFVEEEKFSNLSLYGLAGYLWTLSDHGYRSLIDLKIQDILDRFDGQYLHVSDHNYSPYLSNGSAGIGLFLLNYNFETYKEKIIEIAEGLSFISAKNMGVASGLAGISYFLLEVYQKTNNQKYLLYAIKQLKNCRNFFKNGSLYDYQSKKYQDNFLTGSAGIRFVEQKLEEVICPIS